ncbi:glycoside hydrolase family 31 protein [Kineosporia babensis]|uniref:Family 31 glucosidase n=1 Tax=Kineosporia babensis TaxID=499548 RepID=A0A9X1NPW9_9ACTN|nr:TIM-barrel domain-containing protein [Kineosporia babensis]MCD5316998.1 hypothetical protein [Kineosporia babensis]
MFEKTSTSLTWRGGGELVQVDAWGRDSVRTRATFAPEVADHDFALLPPKPCEVTIDVNGDTARIVNGRLTVVLTQEETLDWQTGYALNRLDITYLDADGKVLLREAEAGGALKLRARDYRPIIGSKAFRLTASFQSRRDEHLVGMGLYQQTVLDLKGSTLELAHRNSQASVPFVVSDAGYGFLWHNPAIGRATFGNNRTEWHAESTEQLDYWITAAGSPRQIAAAYADATGHVPMMPEYGLGFWQCKLRYWNQEQLLEVAREHRRRDIPIDVIVADFFHWPKMGDFRFEEEFWPDPQAMVDELRELDIELMVSVWPQIALDSENYAELRRNNHLVRAERGLDVHMAFGGRSAFVDVTHPGAREAIWQLARRNYYDLGIKLFWLDEAEPEYAVYDFDNYRYHLGPNVQIGNLYPQMFSRTFHDGMTDAGQDQIVNLVRSAWAGSQRYGALVWSGDIGSTFEDLRRQVVAGIQIGMAGIPWFTTDIGGFHSGDSRDPNFRELLVRWFQFGTFSPVMRLHGDRQPSTSVIAADGSPRVATGADNEIWSFGEEAYDILQGLVRLRERLRDYTREQMRQAHEDGQPVMRGLFYEFADDPAAWDVADEYLFGPDLLIAPVMEPGARSREVYLPAGSSWTDLRDGTEHQGGITITVAAPLESIPVFARDGALPELIGVPA